MRVLQVNKFLYRRGGAEASMEDSAGLLRRAGHDVAFFGMDHPENTHTALRRHFPRNLELEPAAAGPWDRARAAARMLWSTSAARGMLGAVEEFRPDVVHLHNIYHHLSPSVLRPLARLGVPAVMTLHDYKLACPTYLFMDHGAPCEACLGGHFTQAVRRRCKDGSLLASGLLAAELSVHTRTGAYGPVDLFACPSRFIHDRMRRAGVYPDRLRVLHHFVEPDDGAVRGPRRDGPVLFVGRLSAEKGADLLVDAAAGLPPGRRLVVVGEGPDRTALEQRAARVAPGRVTFLGRLDKAGVRDLLRTAAVLVAPSRCYENQPLTVLEAFAAGVPVVGADHGGIAEIVGDGQGGVLVPPGDVGALAAAVRDVLADPVAAAATGRAGQDLVRRDYSPQVHLDGLLALYAEAASRHGRRIPVVAADEGAR